jgi:type IV secretory pathway TrbD component
MRLEKDPMIERISIAYLAGAATVTAFAVATGGTNLTLFLLGIICAVIVVGVLGWLIGAARLASWFAAVAATPAAAKPARAVQPPARQAANVQSITRRPRTPKPLTDEDAYRRYLRMPRKQRQALELDAWNEAFEKDETAPAPAPAAVELFSEPTEVEQAAVSALVNLGVPAKRAAAAVDQATTAAGTQLDFDSLFRDAVSVAQKGQVA